MLSFIYSEIIADDQLSTNENLKVLDKSPTANEHERVQAAGELRLNMIQNILADDFEVEIINYDPDTFPNPKKYEGDDDKKPVLIDSNENESLPIAAAPSDPLFGNLIFEVTVSFLCKHFI